MNKVIVACVQMDVELGKVEANRRKIIERIKAAARDGAGIVILPECALSGYCYESLEEAKASAEPENGPSSRHFVDACRDSNVYAVIGFIEQDRERFFNSAMLLGPEGVLGVYRKVHLPYIGVDRFLTPGDRPFAVTNLSSGRVGINICYDASFPEAARSLKLLGAQLILLPTNWPPAAWRTVEFVINTRAHENHVNLAAANRVGIERGWKFIGRSKIVDFNGDTLAEAGPEEETILTAEIDMSEASMNRIVNVAGAYELDRIEDRRPRFYGVIAAPTLDKSTSTAGGSPAGRSGR